MDKKPEELVFFCSAASRYFKEMLHGTAANYQSYILIEHSDPFPGKISEAHFDKDWLRGMEKLAKRHNGKVLLIRNKKSDFKHCRIRFVDCRLQRYFTITCDVKDASTIDIAPHIEVDETVWEHKSFFAVCTNGKKDKCCSKFGFPVYKFFEGHTDETDMEVWECTHVGGDRFAANVVCLPEGIYYGRVLVEDVEPILSDMQRGKIYMPNYRGLSTLSFFEQSVEYYLREYLQNFNIRFPFEIADRETEGNIITIFINLHAKGIYRMVLEKEVIPYPHFLTCKSNTKGNITKYLLKEVEELVSFIVQTES
ncbi:MAG: sucrase ferredoxin [Niabella sp.]